MKFHRIAKVGADNDVCELNRRAASIMEAKHIPTVDLHAAIVGECGPAPQPTCFGLKDCFSPHCGAIGYEWLANSTVVPAIRALL